MEPDYGPDADYDSHTGNHDAPNARRMLDAYEAEIDYQRRNQDAYINDVRSRAVNILTVVSAAVLILAAFADLSQIAPLAIVFAATGTCLLVTAAIQVHRPRNGFYTGVDLEDAVRSSQSSGDLDTVVRWRLAEWTADNLKKNEDGPITEMQRWFFAELVGAAVIVLSAVIGLATV